METGRYKNYDRDLKNTQIFRKMKEDVKLVRMKLKMNITFYSNVRERTCEANQAGENSSFIFTVCVKSVPRYHFKLACVVLQTAVKEFFKTHF